MRCGSFGAPTRSSHALGSFIGAFDDWGPHLNITRFDPWWPSVRSSIERDGTFFGAGHERAGMAQRTADVKPG